jgi:hypothetical protein
MGHRRWATSVYKKRQKICTNRVVRIDNKIKMKWPILKLILRWDYSVLSDFVFVCVCTQV